MEDQFDPTLTNLMILAQICKALLFCLFFCLLFKQCPEIVGLITKDVTLLSVTLEWMIDKTVLFSTQSLLKDVTNTIYSSRC